MVSIFVGAGSVLHCWQILVFSSAYVLNFINRPIGSLFWLLRVPFGSPFRERLGPYWVPNSKHRGLGNSGLIAILVEASKDAMSPSPG